jgi:hypothetical protein
MLRKIILNKNMFVRWLRFIMNVTTIVFLCGTIFIQHTEIKKYRKMEIRYKEQQRQIDSLLRITNDTITWEIKN